MEPVYDGVQISYSGQEVEVPRGKSLLESFEREGMAIPSSCRAGICQSCLLRAIEGQPPAAAQKGLKPTLQTQGYFLACLCYPSERFSCAPGDDAGAILKTSVLGLRLLSPDVVLVRLGLSDKLDYRGGQFVNLRRSDGLTRSYSLASLPSDGPHLELHVRRTPQGRMSSWIHEELAIGDEVEVRGPHGDCFYLPENTEESLLLVGTGTGIAPLYAVLRDALSQGHKGSISFFQGGLRRERLYLIDELAALAEEHPNLHYTQVLLESESGESADVRVGKLDDVVLSGLQLYKSGRTYLCGDADMVNMLRKRLFLAGFSLKRIHSDAFVSSR